MSKRPTNIRTQLVEHLRELRLPAMRDCYEHEAQRAQQRTDTARSVTFRHCAAAYIEARKPSWTNAKHSAQWTATLDAYAMPIIGNVPVQSVDVAMVTRILEPIWSKKSETASRLRGRIEAILDWATTRDFRQGENPARWKGHLENLFPRRSKVQKVQHHPALPYSEIGAFMAGLETEEATGALALQFTILTAARTGEVIGAMWDEIDLENSLWTLPAERMKSDREHRVPLSTRALAILRKRQKATGRTGFVFPGAKAGTMREVLPSEVAEISANTARPPVERRAPRIKSTSPPPALTCLPAIISALP
ncbi:MAG: tyrosine-type recombinase/integrase [Proteobacteria bacterium]|nr:tyrosine-type recombinase/integrase [Pseudomonadota bacterium]